MSKEDLIPDLPPFIKEKGFILKEKVGGGGFSKVYRATWNKRPNEDIAAKIISLTEVDQTWALKNVKNEMKIMRVLTHPNIIRVYEVIKTPKFAYIFMEFAKNGSVFDIMKKAEKPLSESKAKKYTKDIVNGLAYCHKQGYAHRDIKPDNFLVDQNDKALLSDFGFACYSLNKTEVKLMKGTDCGTDIYKAIEIKVKKEGEVYDAKATDLYSLGLSLYAMVYFNIPFDPRNEREMIRKQLNKEYRHSNKFPTSEALKNLIDELLNPDPKTRITSEGVLKHKWIN